MKTSELHRSLTTARPCGKSWRGLLLVLLLGFAGESVRAQLIISEFRVRGPNGANDEFIELFNNSGASHTVAGGGTGYAVVASDGVARCVVPNGTVIPNGGHYLCTNSVGYSLSSYPAGNGVTATGDKTYTTNIPDNAGIAIFNTSLNANFTLPNRLDAVGSTSEANTVYKEGTGYPALTPFSIDYSFHRKIAGTCTSAPNNCGLVSDSFPAPASALTQDTNNNAVDFIFVDTNGTSAGAGQRLGAPSPENLSSPVTVGNTLAISLIDTTKPANGPPNLQRNGGAFCAPPNPIVLPCDPANNSIFGTISFRRRITNNTGAPITRLRFRVEDQTTFPAVSGVADLRTRTSSAVVIATIDDPATCAAKIPPEAAPCSVTAQGTTLEQPPSQPNGSAYGCSMSAGNITLGTPLPAGASINLQFLLGIQQMGSFRFGVVLEALPAGGGYFLVTGETESADVSVTKTDSPDPVTAGNELSYTITAANAAGSAGDARNVKITDVLPANTTFVSLGFPPGWTATAPPPGANGTVTAMRPSLAKGASEVLTLTVRVDAGTPAGATITNTATISASNFDEMQANNSATAETLAVGGPPPSPTPTASPTATPIVTPTPTPTPTPSPTPAQALNISTRLRVDIGDRVMIGGFIIRGIANKPVVLRGLGPSLAEAGVPAGSVLNDPKLELRGPDGALILSNDDWVDSSQRPQIEGTIFEPSDDREAVILATLAPGNYTTILSGVDETTGIGLVEVYDNDSGLDSDLANISTRGFVRIADEVMIGGFTLGGNSTPTRIAARALGPSLSDYGLSNVLQDPTLELHNADGTIMVSNDNWQDDSASATQLTANGLAPTNSFEAGIFTDSAPPGQFTAIVAGKNGGIGISLVEIYNLR